MKRRPSLGAVAFAMVFGAALALAGVKQAAWREASLGGDRHPLHLQEVARAEVALKEGRLVDAARELDSLGGRGGQESAEVRARMNAGIDRVLDQARAHLKDATSELGVEEARRQALVVLKVRPTDVAAKRILDEADGVLLTYTDAETAKDLFAKGDVARARTLAEKCAPLEPACADLVEQMKRFEKQYERLKDLTPAEAKDLVELERRITGGDIGFAETLRDEIVTELVRRGTLDVAGERWREANQAVSAGLELAPGDGRLNKLGRDLQKNGAQLMARAAGLKKTNPRKFAELMRRLAESVPEPYLSPLKVGTGDDAL